ARPTTPTASTTGATRAGTRTGGWPRSTTTRTASSTASKRAGTRRGSSTTSACSRTARSSSDRRSRCSGAVADLAKRLPHLGRLRLRRRADEDAVALVLGAVPGLDLHAECLRLAGGERLDPLQLGDVRGEGLATGALPGLLFRVLDGHREGAHVHLLLL